MLSAEAKKTFGTITLGVTGISPVTDSCGTAAGVLPGRPQGAAGADYTNTKNAKVGDLGSKLPPLPTGTYFFSFSSSYSHNNQKH